MTITYAEKTKEKVKSKYSYKVRDDYRHWRGYTNSTPKNGCIVIDSTNSILCGTFELTEI